MAESKNQADLLQLIAEAAGAHYTKAGDDVVFHSADPKEQAKCRIEPYTTMNDIENLCATVSKKKSDDGIRLFDDTSYEAAIRITGHDVVGTDELFLQLSDPIEGLSYELGHPSDEYIVHLLLDNRGVDVRDVGFVLRRDWENAAKTCDAELERVSVFDVLRGNGVFRTLRIKYEPKKDAYQSGLPLGEFENLAASFIFQLSYNLDVGLSPFRDCDDLITHVYPRTGHRFVDPSEIQPPRRKCIPELVYYYQAAIASESPAAQFLSYYHVIEYFFESVFQQHSIKAVRDIITSAGFSHHRDQDIERLISSAIRNRKLLPSGVVTANEKEALQLTLKAYVDWENVIAQLSKLRKDLAQYFRTTNVAFVKGDTKVDLEQTDAEQIVKRVAARVYMTRNAVVHSKGGVEERFVPFRHDRDMEHEVLLVRVLAEEVIHRSASVIHDDIPF